MKTRTHFKISKFFLVTSPLSVPLLCLILVYPLRISWDTSLEIAAIIFPAILAFFVHFSNQRNIHNAKLSKQNGLVNGLIAELDVLDGDKQDIFGGTNLIGNINWYQQQIYRDSWTSLDHEINPISLGNYISNWNEGLYLKENFGKIVRTLSNINDKISQLNNRISENRTKYINSSDKKRIQILSEFHNSSKSSCLDVIFELLPKIRELRKELIQIKQYFKSQEIGG